MIDIKKCKFNQTIICGVVKNINNCYCISESQCKANNVENWLASINARYGTITLMKYRYNLKKIPIAILDEQMCNVCKVIWTDGKCLICEMKVKP